MTIKALLMFFALLLSCAHHHQPAPIMVNGRPVYCWVERSGDVYGGDLRLMPAGSHRVTCPSGSTFTQ